MRLHQHQIILHAKQQAGILMLILHDTWHADADAELTTQSQAKQCVITLDYIRHTHAAEMHALHSIRPSVLVCAAHIPASVEAPV